MPRNSRNRPAAAPPESIFESAPHVERLEDRLLLAGSLRVMTNAAGDITIRGDGRTNYAEVSVEVTDQNGDGDTGDIVIRGVEDTSGSATTIRVGRDRVSQIVLDATGGEMPARLTVTLGGGNDLITLRGIEITGDFRYQPGGGSDSLGFFDSTAVGKSSFRTGGGNDFINIVDSSFEALLDVNTGGGVDYIGLSGFSLASGQLAKLVTGGGVDIIYIEDSTVAGDIYADTGSLVDAIYVADGTILNGSVTVEMGSLFDLLLLENDVQLNGTLDIDGGRSAFYENQLFLYDDSPFLNNPPAGIQNFETTYWTISGDNSQVGFELSTTLSRWIMDVYNEPVIDVIDAIVAANMARGFDYADLPRSDLGPAPNPAELESQITSFIDSNQYYLYQKFFLKGIFQNEIRTFDWYDLNP